MSNKKYFKCTNKYLEKYKQNQMQIDCIKNILINHADVPEELLNWLIQSVKENAILEANNNLRIRSLSL